MNKIIANETTYTGTGVLNVFLAAAIVFLAIYFVVVTNSMTASEFRIGLLNDELAGLTEANGILTARKLSIEDSSVIFDFVRSHNMVEASRVTHIFESGEVAALR